MPNILSQPKPLLHGTILCLMVVGLAFGGEVAEHGVFHRVWIEPLVLAILIGIVIRGWWTPTPKAQTSLSFLAKIPLNVAIALFGATLEPRALRALDPALLGAIVGIVIVIIPVGYALGRLLGVSPRLALLIACGNAVCGNSAVAAIAPVIGASGAEVGTSIAFTAALGVGTVLILPLFEPLVGPTHYGILAGLSVYAVPQVLAAAAPYGAGAMQLGILVKMVRVMMLGPLLFGLSCLIPNQKHRTQVVPPYLVGFFLLGLARCLGCIPPSLLSVVSTTAMGLTVVAMAALGLMSDPKQLLQAGPRSALAGLTSLSLLVIISLVVIHFLA